jgi:hypothetical protein
VFRHIALFRFVDDATDEQVAAVVEGLRSLPAQIPELVDYRVGPDAGITDGSYDFAVVADFAEEADFPRYRDHPAHQAVATGLVRPILADRATVQYRC